MRLTRSAAIPVAIGAALVGLEAVGGPRSFALVAGVAILLGAIWPDEAARAGALLVTPVAVAALVQAALHSAGLFAVALVATPFALATSALLAIGGSLIRRAHRHDSPETT